MKILALDTATECCSAALWLDGAWIAREHVSPREHSALILPMVHELLGEAGLRLQDLDCLAFGRGPGGFTGVRIAAGLAQGLAFGAGLPVWPVSDLTALAEGARRVHGASRVLAVMDARMREVYWSALSFSASGDVTQRLPERVSAPAEVALPPGEDAALWHGAGAGWGAYAEPLSALAVRLAAVEADRLPHAVDVAALAARAHAAGEPSVEPHDAIPVYLRDRVVSSGP